MADNGTKLVALQIRTCEETLLGAHIRTRSRPRSYGGAEATTTARCRLLRNWQPRNPLRDGRMGMVDHGIDRVGRERRGVVALQLHQGACQVSRIAVAGGVGIRLELVS